MASPTSKDVASQSDAPASIVCCTVSREDRTEWYSNHFSEYRVDWYLTQYPNLGILQKLVKRPDLGKIYGSFKAVRLAKQLNAKLLISQEAELTFWCAFFSKILGNPTEHVAVAFNYPFLPNALRRIAMTACFDAVSHFVVSSTVEKQLYREYFKIPPARIEVQLWKMGEIYYEPQAALETEDYICAIGRFGRDYKLLIAAMHQLPHLRLVLVVGANSLNGLEIPPNVKVMTDISPGHAANILKFSRFMVLPLINAKVPTGHITLVTAMKLAKGSIVTNSSGIQDYIQNGRTALTYEAGNLDSLTQSIAHLWQHPEQCRTLGANAAAFAAKHCSEPLVVQHLSRLLAERGLLNRR
ncbi:glycosyltransferase [Altericista sp. CCNU0014]|uniref:glycosyltransferase n=1 Tax=Altericista sp. CCNU0014 TaxID=3082949 RepID=UPI0038512299